MTTSENDEVQRPGPGGKNAIDEHSPLDYYRDDLSSYYEMEYERFCELPREARIRINELAMGFSTALKDLRAAHNMVQAVINQRDAQIRSKARVSAMLHDKRIDLAVATDHILDDHEVIQAAWRMHGPSGEDPMYCQYDGFIHPCRTRRLLSGDIDPKDAL
jgi:hypothetical protein